MGLLCKIGIHKEDDGGPVFFKRCGPYRNAPFKIYYRCARCGEIFDRGTLETPLPQYMENWHVPVIDNEMEFSS